MTKQLIVSPDNPSGILVDFTTDEENRYQQDNINIENRAKANKDAVDKKAVDSASGNTKLLGLGLTQDEVTALTGYKP